MANSVMGNEETAWAQTFVTVTPHDDGFLREIDENVVVSGSNDNPLNLDTWSIVMRRSLADHTRDWIDPKELERFGNVDNECQTYLRGVPDVELPLVYRDEATQTLYIGRNATDATTPMEYFNDVITVLNDRSLPQLKTTRSVQTENLDESMSNVITDVRRSTTNTTIDGESASTTVSDILNFIIDRTLWMTRSKIIAKTEKKDAQVQTQMMYNHAKNLWTTDFEMQTKLTCKPEHSNSMLLRDYTKTKEFCRDRVNECVDRGVNPRLHVDDIVDEIMAKCESRKNLERYDRVRKSGKNSMRIIENWKTIDDGISTVSKYCGDQRCAKTMENNDCGYVEDKTTMRPKVTRVKKVTVEKNKNCVSRSSSPFESTTSSTTSWRSGWQTSETETSSASSNDAALTVLKNAFSTYPPGFRHA